MGYITKVWATAKPLLQKNYGEELMTEIDDCKILLSTRVENLPRTPFDFLEFVVAYRDDVFPNLRRTKNRHGRPVRSRERRSWTVVRHRTWQVEANADLRQNCANNNGSPNMTPRFLAEAECLTMESLIGSLNLWTFANLFGIAVRSFLCYQQYA